jgi:DNA-3-methyladenine glycosylase I
MVQRCEWANSNALMKAYHDKEWGVPQHDDLILFEFLIIEGMQAGLSWNTILNKRDNFKNAFDNFQFYKIAQYETSKIEELLENKGIIRNRLKIESVVSNAKSFIKIVKEFGSFNKYIWAFVNNEPIQHTWNALNEIPSRNDLSDKISKDLKKRGFKFVGSTIVYAFMQAVGLINDHLTNCFRHKEVNKIT